MKKIKLLLLIIIVSIPIATMESLVICDHGRNILYKQLRRDFDLYTHDLNARQFLKQYRYVLNRTYEVKTEKNPYPNKVWVYWHESYEKVPAIVQSCIESMRRHIKDHDIIFVHKDNVAKYVKIPDYILKKYEKGMIGHAHFADIVRVFLLSEYGGLWMDASTYLTDGIPEWIWKSEFCAPYYVDKIGDIGKDFTFANAGVPPTRVFELYFLHIKEPHSYIFECFKEFLKEYWKENDTYDYFLLINFESVAIEYDKRFAAMVEAMLQNATFSNSYSIATRRSSVFTSKIEVKGANLNYQILTQAKYSEKEWKEIKKFPIHKIHAIAKIAKMNFKKGTYGYKLINGELN